MAAKNGHIDVVRFLFERIKDKNPQSTYGRTTPLHLAARSGHIDVVHLLVRKSRTKILFRAVSTIEGV